MATGTYSNSDLEGRLRSEGQQTNERAMAGMAPSYSQSDLQELKRRLPDVPDTVISHFLATVGSQSASWV